MSNILIVEDEPAIAESLAYALRRDGFSVTLCPAVQPALSELEKADLILLDLMLPDGSGFELIGASRRSSKGPAVIVLSSRDGEADRVAALETGADDYVTKPFSPREIVARVRAVLRRLQPGTVKEPSSTRDSSARRETSIPISVDEETRRAVVSLVTDPGGNRAGSTKELDLTRVEFDLLACMLSAPGRVFTRGELIDRVWGDGFAISDRTIDSHVKGLRRKVEGAGGDPNLVETVRGVGYRINDRLSQPTD